MSNIITSGLVPKRLWPGVWAFYGDTYGTLDKEYPLLVQIEKSDKRYEEIVNMVPMPMATVKQEGNATQYNTFKQGVTTRTDNVTYSTGFIMTHEVGLDDQYDVKLSAMGAKFMAHSMLAAKETVIANLFNNAFSSSFKVGDGLAFGSASHNYGGVNFSNLSTAAALSEAAIEQMVIDIMNQTDDAGIKIPVKPLSIHVPVALRFTVKRILGTPVDLRPGTANRDISALVAYGEDLPIHVHRYLTSSTAFFIKTNVPNGTILFERESETGGEDNDFDTGNRKFKLIARYTPTVGDPRGWQCNQGA